MSKPLRRIEQAALTRERLLEAARAVFTERGFHATSLDAVAVEAGFTKGAVYSQFDSKADLFLALLEQRIASRTQEMWQAAEGVRGTVELATVLSRQWDEKLRHDEQWSLLLIEFRLHAARVPELNRRYAALHAKLRDAMAELIEREARESGKTLAVSAQDIARSALAIGTGAVLERCAEGENFPLHLMEMANRALSLGFGVPDPAGGEPTVRGRKKKASP
jgi:AcrR family transcriptional regulator